MALRQPLYDLSVVRTVLIHPDGLAAQALLAKPSGELAVAHLDIEIMVAAPFEIIRVDDGPRFPDLSDHGGSRIRLAVQQLRPAIII